MGSLIALAVGMMPVLAGAAEVTQAGAVSARLSGMIGFNDTPALKTVVEERGIRSERV